MRFLTASLMTLLTLSAAQADTIRFCFLICGVEPAPVVDSFCQSYQKVNQSVADSAEIKRLSRGPKVRLNANEILYLCKCRGWANPICKETK